MPALERATEDVLPEMNQRSSATTARRKTRFVVRRGRMGVPSTEERENLRGRGAKREYVPVPVLILLEVLEGIGEKLACLVDVRLFRGSHG